MKKLILLILLLVINLFNCQSAEEQYSESIIYKLKLRLEKGDKNAFFELAPYFDSHKKLIEFLGYHYLETEENYLARRAIRENSIFTKDEISIDSISNSKEYLNFLNKNNNRIKFSPSIDAFYITPINERKELVELRELPRAKLEKLLGKRSEILCKDWIKVKRIDTLLKQNDPECLLKICEEFYRQRDRFNAYNKDQEDFHDLLKILIRKDIGAVAENNNVAWDTNDFNFDNNAILKLLIFFSKNYKNFTWNNSEKHFINTSLKTKSIDQFSDLFENLYNENDTIALSSYIKLTQSDPKRIAELCTEKEKNLINHTNSIIPIFPFRFLKQLALLTEYCKQNQIDFIGSNNLNLSIEKLKVNLSFNERRQFEDELIKNLKFEDITPLEYWSLIYEKESELSKSVSRILDIYYTKKWSQIVNNPEYLKLYLKKALLFSRIGINGDLNYYHIKFTNNGSEGIEVLNKLKSNDPDINDQITRAKKICLEKFQYPIENKKVNSANFNSQYINIKNEIGKITLTQKEQDDFESKVVNLMAKIDYKQIPDAIKTLEKINFDEKNYRSKYTFLERDFGFFLIDNWKSQVVRDNFLSVYNSYNEKQLYTFYLDKAEIDYKNVDGSINYDKVFEILKFNIVTPFTGSQQLDNEVGAIIKLLELEFKTTLGYPNKLCNSAGIYICPPSDRAWEWQKYLEDRHLLKSNHSNIVSFNYGYYLDKVLPYKEIN